MTCIDCKANGADCLTEDRVRVCADCLYERVVRQRDALLAEIERLRWENERLQTLLLDCVPKAWLTREQRIEVALRQHLADATAVKP